MSKLLKLVPILPPPISEETIKELEGLLAEARAGVIVGIAYTALHVQGGFSVNAVGSLREYPLLALGMVRSLEQHVATLFH